MCGGVFFSFVTFNCYGHFFFLKYFKIIVKGGKCFFLSLFGVPLTGYKAPLAFTFSEFPHAPGRLCSVHSVLLNVWDATLQLYFLKVPAIPDFKMDKLQTNYFFF